MRVDYTRVAGRYDANPIRHAIDLDPVIATQVKSVLDLACGTGNYLKMHIGANAGRKIAWHGIDACAAMLAVAAAKLGPACSLKHGSAEQLPYNAGSFDYVVNRFAFHHFTDKNAALRQVRRVLVPKGRFKIVNLAPELSSSCWLYRYFPATIPVDQKRFWGLHRLTATLEELGFSVRVTTTMPPLKFAHALKESQNRETSHLLLIEDVDYERGVAAMENDFASLGPDALINGPTLCELTAELT